MATIKQVANKIGKDLNESYPNIQNLFDVLKRGFKDMEDVTGGGGSGSEVDWTQLQVTGTKIAEIEIDGETTNVYAPASQTIAVSQIQTTGTKIASISLDGVSTDVFVPFKFTSAVSAAISATSAIITDAAITTSSVIDIFSETSSGKLINVKQCVVTTGQAVLSFDALEEAASFKLQIFN